MAILTLSESEVRQLLDPELLLDALAEAFKALSEGTVVAPARNELVVPDAGFLLTMPAFHSGKPLAVKLVSVFHGNDQRGIPTHQALICLFDAETGTPLALMGGTTITAQRTAGAAALSTRLLSRQDARILAIVGAGTQGRAHLAILPHVRDFQEIRIASRSLAAAQRLAATDPRARAVASIEAAVRGADVVCLCTASDEPVITAEWLAPGAHVTSVGYRPPGGELAREVLARGSLFVETRLAFASPPAGCAELAGLSPKSSTEIGEVLSGRRPGRQMDDELTVYKAMGHACEDLAAASLVYRQAIHHGVGHQIAL